MDNADEKDNEIKLKPTKSRGTPKIFRTMFSLPKSLIGVIRRLVLWGLVIAMGFGIYYAVTNFADNSSKEVVTENLVSKKITLTKRTDQNATINSYSVKDEVNVNFEYASANDQAFISFKVTDLDATEDSKKVVYTTNKIKLIPNETKLVFPLSIPDLKPGSYQIEGNITPNDQSVYQMKFKVTE